MIKGCLFDLDGTLLNTLPTIAHYVNEALRWLGFGAIEESRYKYFAGHGAKNLIRRALAHHGCSDPVLLERCFLRYTDTYNQAPLYLTTPYDGILPLLEALRQQGMPCAVLSNKQDEAVREILPRFFGDAFIVVRGALPGVPLKPDPAAALALLRELGLAPGECLYVGDTDVDMQTGKRAGMRTVGVLWGFREKEELAQNGADLLIARPQELLTHLS
ncbi:MAG: HAD family hydrolase [Eubacteriales bacterium]